MVFSIFLGNDIFYSAVLLTQMASVVPPPNTSLFNISHPHLHGMCIIMFYVDDILVVFESCPTNSYIHRQKSFRGVELRTVTTT
jgi:hypothetical protein